MNASYILLFVTGIKNSAYKYPLCAGIEGPVNEFYQHICCRCLYSVFKSYSLLFYILNVLLKPVGWGNGFHRGGVLCTSVLHNENVL